jgi:hypothetical protein
MRFLFFAILAFSFSPVLAAPTNTCLKENIYLSAGPITKGNDALKYELTIKNGLSIDLGGVIIRYELWSKDRPTSLASGYADIAHTIRGGLLSGETAALETFIGLRDREMSLAIQSTELTVLLTLENAADLEQRPIADGYDPFNLWSQDRSERHCERRPE